MGRRCAGPGWPRRACAEGGGWRRRHKGRDRGEKGGWKRRMPVVPSPRYESANSLLPPGFSRYPLSLSILSLFLFLSSIQSIGSQPCLSVPRELPPHSASRESSSDQPRYLSALFRQKSLSLVQNCIVRQIGSIVFFFPLYIHNQSNRLQKRYFSRIFIRSFRSIILRFTCRRVEKCVSSHEHLFFSRIRGEREREKERKRSARDLECCAKMDFHEGMDIQGWDKGSPIPLKPEPADLRNGTEVSLVL